MKKIILAVVLASTIASSAFAKVNPQTILDILSAPGSEATATYAIPASTSVTDYLTGSLGATGLDLDKESGLYSLTFKDSPRTVWCSPVISKKKTAGVKIVCALSKAVVSKAAASEAGTAAETTAPGGGGIQS